MRRPLAALLLGALAATASGCSFIAVRRPPAAPPDEPDAPLGCTESPAAPVADTVGAIATPLTGFVVWAVCVTGASVSGEGNCDPVAWAAVLGTAAYAASAGYGYWYTGECRRLAAERRARPPAPAPASRTGGGVEDADPGGLRPTPLCLDTSPPRAERPAAAPFTRSAE
jgi:hypothetical protein